MTSSTALAYYAWVDEKSQEADSRGKKGELWRVFFLYLAELANARDAYQAAIRAADVELLFNDLKASDIQKIASYNSNLILGISKLSENREGNVVINSLTRRQQEVQKDREPDVFLPKLRYLKSLGVDDPDIDMFIASITGDVSLLEPALEAGADVSITDGELLRRYDEQLKNYGR